jgi:hypothetical protein
MDFPKSIYILRVLERRELSGVLRCKLRCEMECRCTLSHPSAIGHPLSSSSLRLGNRSDDMIEMESEFEYSDSLN